MRDELPTVNRDDLILTDGPLLIVSQGDREQVIRFSDVQQIQKNGNQIVVVHANGQTVIKLTSPEVAAATQSLITRSWAKAIVDAL